MSRKEKEKMKTYFEFPEQIVAIVKDQGVFERIAGIAYKDELICGCCGVVFNIPKEVVKIEEAGLSWIDFQEEIYPNCTYGIIEENEEENE